MKNVLAIVSESTYPVHQCSHWLDFGQRMIDGIGTKLSFSVNTFPTVVEVNCERSLRVLSMPAWLTFSKLNIPMNVELFTFF